VLGDLGLGWGYTSRSANMQEVLHHYDSLQREFHNRMNELTVIKVRRGDLAATRRPCGGNGPPRRPG
jgi:hypothetical protein